MNIISLTISRYISIAVSFAFIVLTIVFKSSTNIELVGALFGVTTIVASLIHVTKIIESQENKDKIFQLVTLLSALFASFLPYILKYTTNKNALYSTIAFSIIILTTLFITKSEIKE
jgi:hypothetical protein